jgi:hypothetical protein
VVVAGNVMARPSVQEERMSRVVVDLISLSVGMERVWRQGRSVMEERIVVMDLKNTLDVVSLLFVQSWLSNIFYVSHSFVVVLFKSFLSFQQSVKPPATAALMVAVFLH